MAAGREARTTARGTMAARRARAQQLLGAAQSQPASEHERLVQSIYDFFEAKDRQLKARLNFLSTSVPPSQFSGRSEAALAEACVEACVDLEACVSAEVSCI